MGKTGSGVLILMREKKFPGRKEVLEERNKLLRGSRMNQRKKNGCWMEGSAGRQVRW